MERKIDLKLQPSFIELSQRALANNLGFLRKKAGPGVRISSVIKGNAYGHGIRTFLPMAEACGITHFSVFSADEAERALKARSGPDTHIMIMGMISDSVLGWAVENDISFYLFDLERLKTAVKAGRKADKQARVHLQLETGMNRIGFEEHVFDKVISLVKSNRNFLQIDGICTHFAGAESVENYDRIKNQKYRFRRAVKKFRSELAQTLEVHAASSAALLTYPDTLYNMVRVGIVQYGYWPSREVYMHLQKNDRKEGEDPLARVMCWKSTIMSLKSVSPGEFVGYGKMYQTNREEIIATVPIGYKHGFGRNLTNTGYVLVRGERARVVGLVNMNMLTINVTDVPGVTRGDEVVIIGKQKNSEITVASFGEMSNDLNYEVLTRLPADLPRLVVK